MRWVLFRNWLMDRPIGAGFNVPEDFGDAGKEARSDEEGTGVRGGFQGELGESHGGGPIAAIRR